MKIYFVLILLLLITQSNIAQSIDFKELQINGLSSVSSKNIILEKFGKPLKVFNPDYDCGFLSSNEQMKEIESLKYNNFIFTGNNKDNFIIDEFNFKESMYVVSYCGIDLNHKTTTNEILKIFGYNENGKNLSDYIFIPNDKEYSEDGYMFEFIDGKLISISYWSPY